MTGLVKIEKISTQIIHLIYDDKKSLANALLRFEEHYEGETFTGKIFTLGQYREWYSERFGAWTYNRDWDGFNVSDKAFEAFKLGLFDPLTEAEQEIVELIKYKKGKYCVIATYVDSEDDTFEHEICHAMFYIIENYRVEVTNALKKYVLKDVTELLTNMGYNSKVIVDETHAYLCESTVYLDDYNVKYPEALVTELKKIKAKYNTYKREE